jgi:RND superfamily putative drug exporter
VVSADSPSGSIPIPAPTGGPFAQATPTVVDGEVLLQLTLKDKADSLEAERTVTELRTVLHSIDSSIMVGGQTATALDTNLTSTRDRNLIIPAVLVVITLILMVLLRSVVAPLLLTLTTVLSFGAALGISSVFFNNVLGFPGSDPSVPLYAFVFLVALGIDYNIFLMTRVREESLVHGTKEGVLRGLVATGGVITSAGVVLAATFAALAVIPILFLVQLAIIVAFGVLLDALVVRALFVPALVYDVGDKVWWPSRLAGRGRASAAGCGEEAVQGDCDS